MTNFPTLDAPRTTEHGRIIYDHLGHLEPHIDELDTWCTIPIRLAHNQTAGWHLELGPYNLNHTDIETLRAAIYHYDDATKGRA